eukprot:COSAG03_NODE_40103_length_101_cov_1494.000000_1_plen_25_part_10
MEPWLLADTSDTSEREREREREAHG